MPVAAPMRLSSRRILEQEPVTSTPVASLPAWFAWRWQRRSDTPWESASVTTPWGSVWSASNSGFASGRSSSGLPGCSR
ncbi:hypothetical protein COSO111634_29140 [Corallococcus soli]